MVINFTSTNFTNVSEAYYSDPFKCEDKDQLITVQITLSTTGVVNCQSSIDGVTFFDIDTTAFPCSPSGLQSYKDCQPNLLYRLKSTQSVTSAKILV